MLEFHVFFLLTQKNNILITRSVNILFAKLKWYLILKNNNN